MGIETFLKAGTEAMESGAKAGINKLGNDVAEGRLEDKAAEGIAEIVVPFLKKAKDTSIYTKMLEKWETLTDDEKKEIYEQGDQGLINTIKTFNPISGAKRMLEKSMTLNPIKKLTPMMVDIYKEQFSGLSVRFLASIDPNFVVPGKTQEEVAKEFAKDMKNAKLKLKVAKLFGAEAKPIIEVLEKGVNYRGKVSVKITEKMGETSTETVLEEGGEEAKAENKTTENVAQVTNESEELPTTTTDNITGTSVPVSLNDIQGSETNITGAQNGSIEEEKKTRE